MSLLPFKEVQEALRLADKGKAAGPNGLRVEDLLEIIDHVTILFILFNSWLIAGKISRKAIHGRTVLLSEGSPRSLGTGAPLQLEMCMYNCLGGLWPID